ncbi:MAG TPA: alpha/beta hydrolase-fold protein [Gaiellaceae bacterium]|nr:alpha/beta hydrolase-fold protein [Gaiellaceae bacterium]
MSSFGGTTTRRRALGLAGSSGLALFAAASGWPKALGVPEPDGARASGAAAGAPSTNAASFQSQALRSRLHFVVHAPASYASGSGRYPVVYFLHGLPASPSSYLHLDWVSAALARTGREGLLVIPQGTRVADGDPEYHDWGPGDNWETAIARELPVWMDANYRTRADRGGRAIVGYSAGGYGAAIIGLRHPEQFSVVQSWSGYFRPTDPSGRHPLSVGSTRENEDASVEDLVPALATQFARHPTAFAFYVGASDPTFVPANTALERALTNAGVEHLFRLYAGGHTTALWQAHAPAWLAHAADSLSGAPTL